MKVREVINKKAIYITPQASFLEVWHLLFKKHTHALPVINKKGFLVGIITIEDVLSKLYPSYSDTLEEIVVGTDFEELEDKIEEIKSLKAEDMMNKDVYICYPNDPVLKALSKMVVRKVRQLPVIDDNNKLLGVISKRDIFDKLFISKIPFKKRKK